MSSHHIVRDEQEPALYLYEPESCDFATIQQLLEWSPVVGIKAEDWAKIQFWGIKIDVVLYSNSPQKEVNLWQDTIQWLKVEKDYLTEGIAYLQQRGHRTLSLLTDFQSFRQANLDLSDLEIIIYQENYKYFSIRGGHWRKWLPQGAEIRVFSENFVSDNLQKIQTNQYQVLKDGFVNIDNQGTNFWLGENLRD
jgi:thiamine pyrophosphokinase